METLKSRSCCTRANLARIRITSVCLPRWLAFVIERGLRIRVVSPLVRRNDYASTI